MENSGSQHSGLLFGNQLSSPHNHPLPNQQYCGHWHVAFRPLTHLKVLGALCAAKEVLDVAVQPRTWSWTSLKTGAKTYL